MLYHFISAEFDESFGNLDAFKETGSRKRYVGAYVHLLLIYNCSVYAVLSSLENICCALLIFMFLFLLNDSIPGRDLDRAVHLVLKLVKRRCAGIG